MRRLSQHIGIRVPHNYHIVMPTVPVSPKIHYVCGNLSIIDDGEELITFKFIIIVTPFLFLSWGLWHAGAYSRTLSKKYIKTAIATSHSLAQETKHSTTTASLIFSMIMMYCTTTWEL
ncbi:hypothetical protein XELAEV_18035383mg [Xenopus laevis]|uniref:Uncharacterized protein n=1 Tax=Xenopus laevis TaxID=8355 RepID=A0A974CG56_XENLA|nr:hypothetical protein XELAEV_18035383mg [Xenopus laevis]